MIQCTIDSTFIWMINRYLYRLLHLYCSHSLDSKIVFMLIVAFIPSFPWYEQTTSTCTNVCVYCLHRNRVLGQIITVHNFVMWWYKRPYCFLPHDSLSRVYDQSVSVNVLMKYLGLWQKKGHGALNILCSRPTCVTLCSWWSRRPLTLGSRSPCFTCLM